MTSISAILQSGHGMAALLVATLAVGLAVGYALRGFKQRGKTTEGRIAVSPAFLKGLNYLISNNQDKAIEEFTRAVKVDSDTVETYVALGNLFRSKGEIERAIRIRQSIILRHGVDEEIKRQALFDMALDYRRGGFVDRAISTFHQLLKVDPNRLDVYLQLEQLYEETRDWMKGYQTRLKISKLRGADDSNILAHYMTEQGKVYFQNRDYKKAEECLKKAIGLHRGCVDAYLHLADLFIHLNDFSKALNYLKRMTMVAPEMSYLALERLARLDMNQKDGKKIEEFISENLRAKETPYVRLAIARYWLMRENKQKALAELEKALEKNPRYLLPRKLMGQIFVEENRMEQSLTQYKELLALIDDSPREYQCSQCGYTSTELTWKCPQCLRWDTIERTEIEK